ncbi:MAG TPA: M23 family metallopeptidase [Bryobacteraceae bacterium]
MEIAERIVYSFFLVEKSSQTTTSTQSRKYESFLVVNVGHSVRGRIKEFHITRQTGRWLAAAAIFLFIASVALVARVITVTVQVVQYNRLRATEAQLRNSYDELRHRLSQHGDAVATLEALPTELSAAYGLGTPASSFEPGDVLRGTSAFRASIEAYGFLKTASRFSVGQLDVAYLHQSVPSVWPVNGRLTSGFGARMDPFSGEGAYHTGVDLAVPSGTPVHVTANGIVATAGWVSGYGKLIMVDHGEGLQTYYAHLSRVEVVPGQRVSCGEIIGTAGDTGHSTGPHLHYEVRMGGRAVNPFRYLKNSARLDLVARSDFPF